MGFRAAVSNNVEGKSTFLFFGEEKPYPKAQSLVAEKEC
jgi:hypothetical protein